MSTGVIVSPANCLLQNLVLFDGGSKCIRVLESGETTQDENDTDINWMKHTPALQANIPLVIKKMSTTSRELISKGMPAAALIKEFPKFQIIPGLVSVCIQGNNSVACPAR